MSRVSKVYHPDDDLPWEEQTSMMMPSNSEANELSCWTTSRKAKALEPWEQCPDVWKTEAEFFQWMRGQMRRAWARHPVKVSYMHANRVRVPLGKVTRKNPDGMVWGCRCEECHKEFKQTGCEVDHIDGAGSFRNWGEFEAWMIKLMHINWSSIRIVCKRCHKIKSYAERYDMTFEEADLEKQVIAFTQTPTPKQHKRLEALGLPHNNADVRRAAYKQYLQEKLNGKS